MRRTENIELIRSRRRSIALTVKEDGRILVRAPLLLPERDIRRFVESKADWIARRRAALRELEQRRGPSLTEAQRRELLAAARADLTPRIKRFAALMGVSVNRVSFRFQRSRWGSCSSKGGISLNALLMLCPEDIRDYVVVHELAHRMEMNHSPRFWALVERVLPDYKDRRRWLKVNGAAIMDRNRPE